MKAVNSTFLRKTSDHLYSTKSALNTYREEEVLVYINQNYSVIWNAKGKYYPIYHFIKDWVVKGMQMNVIILDATADVLSDYKKTPFRLIQNSGKMYSSPITFQEFPMSLERWLFEKDVDDNTIRDRIQDIERLVGALEDIKRLYSKDKTGLLSGEYINPKVAVSPQEAFYSQKKSVRIMDAVGAVSGEFVMCYPPGIPILAPGELITKEIAQYIVYAKEKGCSMQGTEDPAVEYLKVLEQ